MSFLWTLRSDLRIRTSMAPFPLCLSCCNEALESVSQQLNDDLQLT